MTRTRSAFDYSCAKNRRLGLETSGTIPVVERLQRVGSSVEQEVGVPETLSLLPLHAWLPGHRNIAVLRREMAMTKGEKGARAGRGEGEDLQSLRRERVLD